MTLKKPKTQIPMALLKLRRQRRVVLLEAAGKGVRRGNGENGRLEWEQDDAAESGG